MITRFIALAVSVLLLAGSAPAQTAAELLQKGIYTLQTAGKADEAIELYRQAAKAAGADRATAARAQMMIVSAMIQKGDFNGASREFGALTQNYSDQKDLMASMGSIFFGPCGRPRDPPRIRHAGAAYSWNVERRGLQGHGHRRRNPYPTGLVVRGRQPLIRQWQCGVFQLRLAELFRLDEHGSQSTRRRFSIVAAGRRLQAAPTPARRGRELPHPAGQ